MSLKRLVPYVGHVNTRARQTFCDVPKLEEMLKKSGLQDYYSKSDNLTIVDAYAGYGWFSTALYNSLRPKKIWMMDQNMYACEPLNNLQAQDPEVLKFLENDPFQWRSYYPIYESISKKYNKPDRTEVSRDFLFVSNLAYIRGPPLLYQYLLCILHQNWLQRYGRVRMLFWMSAEAAEKLTIGTRKKVPARSKSVESVDEKIEKVRSQIRESEEVLALPKIQNRRRVTHTAKIVKYEERLQKLEVAREKASIARATHRKYKSTIIREMTCDYRYLIGGDIPNPKRTKATAAAKDAETTPQTISNPHNKDAVVYYDEGYKDLFAPKKVSSLGGIVLLELTPRNFKLERIEEFFFVTTRLFVASSEPIVKTLETLGPGATEWMTPHLDPAVLNKKITEISITDLEQLVEVFWRWPFKPQVLMDTYEERRVSNPDVSTFDTTIFDYDDEEEIEGGAKGDEDDFM